MHNSLKMKMVKYIIIVSTLLQACRCYLSINHTTVDIFIQSTYQVTLFNFISHSNHVFDVEKLTQFEPIHVGIKKKNGTAYTTRIPWIGI